MATAVSPTPVGGARNRLIRRQLSRSQLPPSQAQNKPEQPSIAAHNKYPVRATNARDGTADSSDDEGSAPLLSAAAEELLGVKTGERPATRNEKRIVHGGDGLGGASAGSPMERMRYTPHMDKSVLALVPGERFSPAAPSSSTPRVVRLSTGSAPLSGLRRSASTSSVRDNSPHLAQRRVRVKTPANRPQSAMAHSGGSNLRHSIPPENPGNPPPASPGELPRESGSARQAHALAGQSDGLEKDAAASLPASGSFGESVRHRIEEVPANALNSSSLRVKRVGKVTGRFLSGPARRGMIRRQSDDNEGEDMAMGQSPIQEGHQTPLQSYASPAAPSNLANGSGGVSSGAGQSGSRNGQQPHKLGIQMQDHQRMNTSSKETVLNGNNKMSTTSPVNRRSEPLETSGRSLQATKEHNRNAYQPEFRVPPPLMLPSRHDQENEAPPTFKRNKPWSDASALGDKKPSETIVHPPAGTVAALANANGSPLRRALALRNQNTPLRPAPAPPAPPPKMSVLETATAVAGSSAPAANGPGSAIHPSKKKRNYISVNGKLFTRLECIGRGGSGRVYRVMAENHRLFALKRVSLEDLDATAIRGFKGEIELLKKLERVERVIRLWDYEINEERKTLSVLMDIGELDLKKVLDPRLDEEQGASFDSTFARYIWQEMLECVGAVHEHGIVHSDLKPANFVLCQGRLRLIDFGIANAIQDNTVHVHREQQIGTPNYMAPEALLDANAGLTRPNLGQQLGKLMKLGRPSDVWSLGCILYQITYGRPPFAHLTSSMSKVMAITDRSHAIAFPRTGLGGVPLPAGLIRTLRVCLERDPARRPTVRQLLQPDDPFLHPDAPPPATVAAKETVSLSTEMLARVQESIISRIRLHGMPSHEELEQWPSLIFAGIRASGGIVKV